MATGFIIVGGVFTAATFFFLIRAAWTDKSIGGWLVLAVVAAAMAGIVFWLGMEESYARRPWGHVEYDEISGKAVYRDESRYCSNRKEYEETFVGILKEGVLEPKGDEECLNCGKPYKNHARVQYSQAEIDAAYYGHGYDNDYDFWYLPYLP